MPNEKLFTAKEAALAVLAKAQELLSKGEWNKIHKKLEGEGYSANAADKIDGAIKAKVEKSETGHEKGVHTVSPYKPHPKSDMETNEGSSAGNRVRNANKYGKDMKSSKESVMKDAKSLHAEKLSEIKSMPKPDLGKAEGAPSEKDQTGAQGVQKQPDPRTNPKQMQENGNPAPGALPQNEEKFSAELKGHLKLAKFMGRMDEKRSTKKATLTQEVTAQAPAMGKAETGHEKGINTAANFQMNRPGVSHAGISARSAKINEAKGVSSHQNVDEAKDRQKKVLAEMKSTPKPKLPE